MKKNIVIIVLSVVALLLAGTVGYFISEKVINKKEENSSVNNNENSSVSENNNNKEIATTEKDFNLNKAGELLEYFGFNDNLGAANIYNYNYSDTFKKIKALEKVDSSKIKMVNCSDIYSKEVAMEPYYEGKYGYCKKDSQVESIPYEAVNEIYNKMYGTDIEKDGLSTQQTIGGIYYKFYDYNESLNSFIKLEGLGLGGANGPYFNINKIKSAKTIGNELKIEVYYLYGSIEGKDGDYFSHLSTSKLSYERISATEVELIENKILNSYLDMLDVYEVVFEKNGDNYIFKKLSKKLS